MANRALIAALLLAASGLFVTACDSGSEDGRTVGNVTGTVSDATSGVAVSGASVRIAGAAVTTGEDGAYEILDVAVGSHQLEVSASGYDAHTGEVAITEGANTRDVALVRQSIFEYEGQYIDATALVRPATTRLRGIVLTIFGTGGESRGFVRGGEIDVPTGWEAGMRAYRDRLLELADAYALAVVGLDTHDDQTTAALRDIYAAFDDFAVQTRHPQFAEAPVLIWGASLGGCIGYGLSSVEVERTIGLISQKGGCHVGGDRGPVKGIPAYFFIGENDTQERAANIRVAFRDNRVGGAIWALAVDPDSGHEVAEVKSEGRDLTAGWMREVLDLRLPDDASPDGSTVLRSIEESTGWLGNPQTFEIAPFACYNGDPATASWLPTPETAQKWQHFVSNGTVTTVTPCD